MAASYAAYNEDLPCKNPNCKSNGRPHPNCKCYESAGVYATGGEVESFCRQNKPHNQGCEYFAGGGEAPVYPSQLAPDFDPQQFGAGILQKLIKTGIINGGDGVGNAMLHGEAGDHSGAVASHLANVGAHGLFGLNKKSDSAHRLKEIQKQRITQNVSEFLSGIGLAANNMEASGSKSVRDGADFYKKASSFSVDTDKLNDQLSEIIGRPINSKSRKYVVPAIFKAMSAGDPGGLSDAVDHAESVGSGSKDIDDSVESLFGGPSQGKEFSESKREKLKDYVENGMMNDSVQEHMNPPQQFAQGGDVSQKKPSSLTHGSDPVATHYPDQAMIMGLAKGRINNYLNSVRPLQGVGGLPFDRPIEDKQKSKEYERVVDLANHPLSIMDHVKNSTLTHSHLNHFAGLFPELHDHISKKITERVLKNRLENEDPPTHKVRQSLSLFTGTPMDSTLTPFAIQQAQSVFMKQKANQPQDQKKKKNTAPLTKASKQYETSSQAAEARQKD